MKENLNESVSLVSSGQRIRCLARVKSSTTWDVTQGIRFLAREKVPSFFGHQKGEKLGLQKLAEQGSPQDRGN